MDIYVLIVVPSVTKWQLDSCEAEQKNKLLELNIEPTAYRWNKYICLEPRPLTREIIEIISSESDFENWKCFALKGNFLSKIEEEVNEWIDLWDVEQTSFFELLMEIYENQERALFAFERNSESIDSIYFDKSSDWVIEKTKSVLDRKNKLEGFAVLKGFNKSKN